MPRHAEMSAAGKDRGGLYAEITDKVVADLDAGRCPWPISLLPDREPATAQAWLSEQPQIAIVARDRGGTFSLAVSRALPHAVQVADRWH